MWNEKHFEIKNKFQLIGSQVRVQMYQDNQERVFSLVAWNALRATGFFSFILEYGVKEGTARIAAAMQGFAKGSRDSCFNIGAVCQAALGVRVINDHGSEVLKKKY